MHHFVPLCHGRYQTSSSPFPHSWFSSGMVRWFTMPGGGRAITITAIGVLGAAATSTWFGAKRRPKLADDLSEVAIPADPVVRDVRALRQMLGTGGQSQWECESTSFCDVPDDAFAPAFHAAAWRNGLVASEATRSGGGGGYSSEVHKHHPSFATPYQLVGGGSGRTPSTTESLARNVAAHLLLKATSAPLASEGGNAVEAGKEGWFAVQRLKRPFAENVPVMRLTSFLDGASLRDVAGALLVPDQRLQWDGNYMAFERLRWWAPPGDDATAASWWHMLCRRPSPAATQRPTPAKKMTANGTPASKGAPADATTFTPALAASALRPGWTAVLHDECYHRTGNAWLAKFGVAPRYFWYERLISVPQEQQRLPADGATVADPTMMSIAYRSKRRCDATPDDGPAVVTTPSPPHAKSSDAVVDMRWQEILLVEVPRAGIASLTPEGVAAVVNGPLPNTPPLDSVIWIDSRHESARDVAARVDDMGRALSRELCDELLPFGGRLPAAFWRLGESDTNAARRDFLVRQSAEQSREKKKPSVVLDEGACTRPQAAGTLMIMTSANDAKVPPLPRWIERRIAKEVSHTASTKLGRAARGEG